jgi:hypothetical protein
MVVGWGDKDPRMAENVTRMSLPDFQVSAAAQDLRQETFMLGRNVHPDGDRCRKVRRQAPKITDSAFKPPTEAAIAMTDRAGIQAASLTRNSPSLRESCKLCNGDECLTCTSRQTTNRFGADWQRLNGLHRLDRLRRLATNGGWGWRCSGRRQYGSYSRLEGTWHHG